MLTLASETELPVAMAARQGIGGEISPWPSHNNVCMVEHESCSKVTRALSKVGG